MSKSSKAEGISLGESTRWVINGLGEYQTFFGNLGRLLPEQAAVIYLEGTSIAPEVRSFLEAQSIAPWLDVARGTIWPKPAIFHLLALPEVIGRLEEFARRHANPEIADHCHLYRKDGMILQWYDACDVGCPIGLGASIPEVSVKAFCDAAGGTYNAYSSG